jgi:hypothetical protein
MHHVNDEERVALFKEMDELVTIWNQMDVKAITDPMMPGDYSRWNAAGRRINEIADYLAEFDPTHPRPGEDAYRYYHPKR